MDSNIIIGNVCSLLAMITDSIGSSRKTTKGMLLMQGLGSVIWAAGSIILKGYSAAVQNIVGLLRNLAAAYKVQNKWLEYTLILLGVVLGVVFNNRSWLGILPVVGNLTYSVAMFRVQDNERALKIAFLFCVGSYAIFNAVILNIVGLIANIVIMATTIIFLVKKN